MARDDPWELVHREIDRSRRHRRPLALLKLPGVPQTGAAAMAQRLRGRIRAADSVWAEGGTVYLLLIESNRDAALQLAQRLRDAEFAALTSRPVRLACFPEDGVTANALRAAVGRRRPL